jgi:hypothetical protein
VVIVLIQILSDEKISLSLMNMLGLSSSVHFAHIACYRKFSLVHYTQVLCQYRLCKPDHAYLTYLDSLQTCPTSNISARMGQRTPLPIIIVLNCCHATVAFVETCFVAKPILSTAVVYLLISQSLPSNWSTCNNIKILLIDFGCIAQAFVINLRGLDSSGSI